MTSPDLPTILEEKGGIAKLIVSEDRLALTRNSPKVCDNFDRPAFPAALLYAVFSRATIPCGALSKLEAWKPFTCANIYAARAVRSRCLPIAPRTSRLEAYGLPLNVKLATAIPFVKAAITIRTIN